MRELKIVPIDVYAILEEAGFGGVGEKSKKALATAIEKTIVGIRADLDKLKADVCEQKAVLEADKLAFASFKKQVLAADTALRNALSFISDAKSAMNARNIPEGIAEGPSDALKCEHCGSKKDVWGRTVLFPNGDFRIIDLCAPCNKMMRVQAEGAVHFEVISGAVETPVPDENVSPDSSMPVSSSGKKVRCISVRD